MRPPGRRDEEMNESETLLLYAVACLAAWIICGICCAAIGSSFWWGFWFGPIGIIIAAVRVNGNKRPQIVVINGGSARRRVRIRRPMEPVEELPAPMMRPQPRLHERPTGPCIARPTGRFERRA